MPTPLRTGPHPSGIDSLQFCHGSPSPEEKLELEEGHLAESQPGLLTPGHGEDWHPQLDTWRKTVLLSASTSWALQPALDNLHPLGQEGAVCTSFKLSGWGP